MQLFIVIVDYYFDIYVYNNYLNNVYVWGVHLKFLLYV